MSFSWKYSKILDTEQVHGLVENVVLTIYSLASRYIFSGFDNKEGKLNILRPQDKNLSERVRKEFFSKPLLEEVDRVNSIIHKNIPEISRHFDPKQESKHFAYVFPTDFSEVSKKLWEEALEMHYEGNDIYLCDPSIDNYIVFLSFKGKYIYSDRPEMCSYLSKLAVMYGWDLNLRINHVDLETNKTTSCYDEYIKEYKKLEYEKPEYYWRRAGRCLPYECHALHTIRKVIELFDNELGVLHYVTSTGMIGKDGSSQKLDLNRLPVLKATATEKYYCERKLKIVVDIINAYYSEYGKIKLIK